MHGRARLFTGGLTAVALFAFPAAAGAFTTAVNQRCYTHVPTKGSQPIVVTMTAGPPGAGYVVAATVPGKGLGSAGSSSGQFDAAGNAQTAITDVFPPNGTIDPTRGQRINLSVRIFPVGANTFDVPIGPTLVTTLSMKIGSRPISPRKPRPVRVSGTPFAGHKVYGFVTNRGGTRVLRRVYLGRGDVCGYTTRKAIVAPHNVRPGTYRFYINAGKRLEKKRAISESFRIFRRFLGTRR